VNSVVANNSEPRNVSRIADMPFEHRDFAQFTTVHVSVSLHCLSNSPLKSFQTAPRVAPTKEKRLGRLRSRKRYHSIMSEFDLGWNPVG
jgi:hypothetical protein